MAKETQQSKYWAAVALTEACTSVEDVYLMLMCVYSMFICVRGHTSSLSEPSRA